MVTNVTSFGRSGLYDWMVQRVSAVILLIYFIYLLFLMATTPEFAFADWRNVFAGMGMKIFSLIALLALCAHAWIGMWTVATDYLTTRMLGTVGTVVRLIFQLFCLIVLFVYLVWGIQILWSI